MIIVDWVLHVTAIHSATDNHCVHVNYTSIHRDPHVKVDRNIDKQNLFSDYMLVYFIDLFIFFLGKFYFDTIATTLVKFRIPIYLCTNCSF